MTDLEYPDELTKYTNLLLAYQRAWFASRPIVKDNLGFRVFSRNLAKNLNVLRLKVQQGTFENQPHKCLKFAEPKNNYTLRWYHLLKMEDLIVYQAIANYFALLLRSDLRKVDNLISFGYPLSSVDADYFYQYWKKSYQKFERMVTTKYNQGKCWRLKTDIVSFFENIEHEILLKHLRENLEEEAYPVIKLLGILLKAWSPHDNENQLARGLPIGPSASSFFANIYLYPIDIKFKSKGFFRYVDDIRIMSDSKRSVITTFVGLDEALKEIGLNLQSKKTSLDRIKNISKEIQVLEINEANYEDESNEARLEKLLLANFKNAKKSPTSNRISRYALYRMTGKHRFWPEIISLIRDDISRCPFYCSLLRHNELIGDAKLIKELRKLLAEFDFLAIPLLSILETLAFIGDKSYVFERVKIYISDNNIYNDSKSSWHLRLKLIDIFSHHLEDRVDADDDLLVRLFKKEDNPFIQKYLLWHIFREQRDIKKFRKFKKIILQGKDVDAVLAAICLECELDPSVDYTGFSLCPEIDPYITSRSSPNVEVQQRFTNYLYSFFKTSHKNAVNFVSFFQEQYKSACSEMKRAIDSYDIDPGNFLIKINNVNALIVEKLYHKYDLDFKENYKLDFKNALSNGVFREKCPVLQGVFLRIHELRCDHAAHYWSARLGEFAKPIPQSELTEAREDLARAYNYLLIILSQ